MNLRTQQEREALGRKPWSELKKVAWSQLLSDHRGQRRANRTQRVRSKKTKHFFCLFVVSLHMIWFSTPLRKEREKKDTETKSRSRHISANGAKRNTIIASLNTRHGGRQMFCSFHCFVFVSSVLHWWDLEKWNSVCKSGSASWRNQTHRHTHTHTHTN